MVKIRIFALAFTFITAFSLFASGQSTAPGGPGKDAQWATAGKQAIGTSATLESKVWFTLAQGVMTEVYYPDVTVANVHMLQFIVVNPKTKKVETERDDAIHQIKPLRVDSLSFQQINTAKSGRWKITKTYVTDPQEDAVLIDVRFEPRDPNLELYVYYDPSIGNTGMGDVGTGIHVPHGNLHGFEASDEKVDLRSIVVFSVPISEFRSAYAADDISAQFFGADLRTNREEAGPGNVVQFARIDQPRRFTTVIAFDRKSGGLPDLRVIDGATGRFRSEFQTVLSEYEWGWADYVKTLPKVDPNYQAQFNMAAMVLKAQEDKTVPGANVASLTVPWGGGANANEDVGGGYHLIWSRDLYHVFTAYLAIGDRPAAERALDFLFKIQQKEDGSFPQNSWLDGKRGWGSLQMDEVGYPLIIAWRLGRFDKET
jgi:glucoamylase